MRERPGAGVCVSECVCGVCVCARGGGGLLPGCLGAAAGGSLSCFAPDGAATVAMAFEPRRCSESCSRLADASLRFFSISADLMFCSCAYSVRTALLPPPRARPVLSVGGHPLVGDFLSLFVTARQPRRRAAV